MFEADNRVKIFLAKALYEAGRNDEAASIIKSLHESKFQFAGEEKPLIINIWMGIISPLRSAIMNIEDNTFESEKISTAINTLKEDLLKRSDEIIELLKTVIIPGTEKDEERSNYTKSLADFLRYKCVCVSPENVQKVAEESKSTYQKSLEILHVMPSPPIQLDFRIQLNNAILMADHLGQREQAIEQISELRKEISLSFEKYNDDIKPAIKEIIELMDENVQIWKERGDGENPQTNE